MMRAVALALAVVCALALFFGDRHEVQFFQQQPVVLSRPGNYAMPAPMVHANVSPAAFANSGRTAWAPLSAISALSAVGFGVAALAIARARDVRMVITDEMRNTYSENSRAYRRTVYDHDDWIKHRSSNRWFKNFRTIFESGVVRSLQLEISVVTGVAIFVCLVNCVICGFDDFSGVHHGALFADSTTGLSLPAQPFSIAMSALSLLLVFRTNTAYNRWNEARTLWGGIVNTCRNLQRQSNAYFPDDSYGQLLRMQFVSQVAMFPKALRSFLRGPEDDEIVYKEACALLGPDTAEALMNSKNRQTFVCNLITATVARANINPMDRSRMDESTSKLLDYLGACERIFRSPIPLVYTRLTSRFLSVFMLLLPLALWEPMKGTWNHWAIIPATAVIASFLFGIEELGIQIEEPFGILPLESLCDGSIEGVVVDMRNSYEKGHFGDYTPYEAEGPPALEVGPEPSKYMA
jgi:predicted membrane chloride channel (bestrophin family)